MKSHILLNTLKHSYQKREKNSRSVSKIYNNSFLDQNKKNTTQISTNKKYLSINSKIQSKKKQFYNTFKKSRKQQLKNSRLNNLDQSKFTQSPKDANRQYLDNIHAKIDLIQQFYETQGSNEDFIRIFQQWPNQKIKKNLIHKNLICLNQKNKCFYIGNIANNMLHGFGILMKTKKQYINIKQSNNNQNLKYILNFYEGQFNNNLKHGQGLQYYSDKGIYIGNFVNNKPEGKGIFIWNDQQTYQGQFLKGLKHGYGCWVSKQDSYIGQWHENKPDGSGIIINSSSRYEGAMRSGLKHGEGKQEFKNGDIYVGNYVNGKPQGYGEYFWSQNRSNYRGMFKNGLRHGHGVWVQDGNRYQGQYHNDKKNGYGQFIWVSGNSYYGYYFNDLRHGFGQMKWIDGSWYKGDWKYGLQHGIGEMNQGHRLRKGVFQNNVLILEQYCLNNQMRLSTQVESNLRRSRKNMMNVQQKSRRYIVRSLSNARSKPFSKSFISGHKSQLQGNRSNKLNQNHKTPIQKIKIFPLMHKSYNQNFDIIQWQTRKQYFKN